MAAQRRKKEVNLSVLNTDQFDRMRFKKIYDMSKGLQVVGRIGNLPQFKALIGDIWASLFKTEPAINSEVDVEKNCLGINKMMMERMLSDKKYKEIHSSSRLNDVVSAVATKSFALKVNKWMKEQEKEDKELAEKMEQLNQAKNSAGKGKAERIREAEKGVQERLKQALALNGDKLIEGFAEAAEEGRDIKKGIEHLMSTGDEAGKAKTALESVPLADQLKLADTLSQNKQLRKVAEWAGRFKNIAQKKQRSKNARAHDRNGVAVGNEIENLLPNELLMYANQSTKLDFLRRYAEGQTLSYDLKGKDELGKGPIIAALDESGSMKEIKEQSKGFVLAFMGIARKQKRDFALIRFNAESITTTYPKGEISIDDMVEISTSFLSGGTNFKKPLRESLRIVNGNRFNKADLIFITDGADKLDDNFIESFKAVKREKDFKVLSLVVEKGERINTQTVQKFSDKVITIDDFNDEKAFGAFEI